MTIEEKADISRTVIALALDKYPNAFIACSFGKDSRVLVELATAVKHDIDIVGLDTGYEFPETLEYAKELTRERNLNFRWESPTQEERERIEKEYGDNFVKNGQSMCCEMKIPTANRIMAQYDAWITGLRRDETEFRQNTGLIEQGRIIKINPIAFWTQDDVWEYIRSNKLSYHPLYDAGYPSLGCQPCTTSGDRKKGGGRQGQFERAGRSGNGKECGLHTSVQALAS